MEQKIVRLFCKEMIFCGGMGSFNKQHSEESNPGQLVRIHERCLRVTSHKLEFEKGGTEAKWFKALLLRVKNKSKT